LLFEFLVNSGMIASENTDADYRDRYRILNRQVKFSMAGCRNEIVNGIGGKSIRIAVCCAGRRHDSVTCARVIRHFAPRKD
jgi:hypothetical protein